MNVFRAATARAGGEPLANPAGRLRPTFDLCFRREAEELFELVDAALAADSGTEPLAVLSMQDTYCRAHGALHAALACGEIVAPSLIQLIAS